MDTGNNHNLGILFSAIDMSSSVDSTLEAAMSKSGFVESNLRF